MKNLNHLLHYENNKNYALNGILSIKFCFPSTYYDDYRNGKIIFGNCNPPYFIDCDPDRETFVLNKITTIPEDNEYEEANYLNGKFLKGVDENIELN